MSLWNTYFKVTSPTQADEVTPSLWNDEATIEALHARSKDYQAAVMDQYKLYVEMSDRISQRRGLANTFFVILHSAFLTLVAVFWKVNQMERHRGSSFRFWPVLVTLHVTMGARTTTRVAATGERAPAVGIGRRPSPSRPRPRSGRTHPCGGALRARYMSGTPGVLPSKT
jgi:hypothetical protein